MSGLRIFGWSIGVTIASLVVAFLYGGPSALFLCAILGILEVSLSFDNAVVNATVLRRMSEFWQRIFLTIGIVIAVFGMRLVFPLLIVGVTANLGPIEALNLALEQGDPEEPGSYGYILEEAHPQIAGFGGMFLLMLFLDWIFDDSREHAWLVWLERPLAKAGRLEGLAVVVALVSLVLSAEYLADEAEIVLVSGVLGVITYLAVNGLGTVFESTTNLEEVQPDEEAAPASRGESLQGPDADRPAPSGRGGPSGLAVATGRAGFFLFLYLEVLDASFSFDGVIGAFAITSDPIIIALGLGLIGAMFVRSITVYLVRQGTLSDYVYLEHGAHWAIGALAAILLITIGIEVNEIITGLVGVAFIGAAFWSSVRRNRRIAAEKPAEPEKVLSPR